MNDEFYIGWEDKAPPCIGSRVRRAVVFLLTLAVVLGVLLAVGQRTIGVSVFECGKVKGFSGILKSQPYPHLLVARPGVSDGQSAFSSYYLVKPFKFGLDSETADRLDGKAVSLKGTLIYRGGQTMIEVADNSIRASDSRAPAGHREGWRSPRRRRGAGTRGGHRHQEAFGARRIRRLRRGAVRAAEVRADRWRHVAGSRGWLERGPEPHGKLRREPPPRCACSRAAHVSSHAQRGARRFHRAQPAAHQTRRHDRDTRRVAWPTRAHQQLGQLVRLPQRPAGLAGILRA